MIPYLNTGENHRTGANQSIFSNLSSTIDGHIRCNLPKIANPAIMSQHTSDTHDNTSAYLNISSYNSLRKHNCSLSHGASPQQFRTGVDQGRLFITQVCKILAQLTPIHIMPDRGEYHANPLETAPG